MNVKSQLHRIASGPIELAVTEYDGNGPRVLLIHGIGSSGGAWNNIIPRLAEEFSPVTIDLRGHGESDKPDHGYLYDDYIGDLEAVLAALGMDRPLLIGHSLGGIITLWWAAKHPDTAAALVIEDSPLRSGTDFRPAFECWLEFNALTEDEAFARYKEEHPQWTDEIARLRAHQITSTARPVFSELYADSMAHQGVDRIAEITGVTSPVLLIHGDLEAGGMVHPGDAVSLEERLPNAEAVRLPEANHRIHAERADVFLDLAIPFLKAHAG
jgi:pimeloyl-ACP methyl ester carboxylesterase